MSLSSAYKLCASDNGYMKLNSTSKIFTTFKSENNTNTIFATKEGNAQNLRLPCTVQIMLAKNSVLENSK